MDKAIFILSPNNMRLSAKLNDMSIGGFSFNQTFRFLLSKPVLIDFF